MQFQVPQFVDVSPKIIGPLTLKQFLFLAGAAIPSFILFFILKFWVWLIFAALFFGIAVSFAFAKVNNQPLFKVVVSAFTYFWKPRLYLWRKSLPQKELPSLPKKLPDIPQPKPEAPKKQEDHAFKDILERLRPFRFGEKEHSSTPQLQEKIVEHKTPLKNLSLKIATSTKPIEKREKPSKVHFFRSRSKDAFELLRKSTGEKESARRVDYR